MIDALLNVAVFAALALCIVGFSAWAHKRVDAQQGLYPLRCPSVENVRQMARSMSCRCLG